MYYTFNFGFGALVIMYRYKSFYLSSYLYFSYNSLFIVENVDIPAY